MVWQIPCNFTVYSTVSKLCVTGPLWGHWWLPWYSNAKNVSMSWNIVNLTATKSRKNFFLMNLLLKLSPAFSKFPSNYKFGAKLDILHKIRTLWSKKIWNNLIFTRLKKRNFPWNFDYKLITNSLVKWFFMWRQLKLTLQPCVLYILTWHAISLSEYSPSISISPMWEPLLNDLKVTVTNQDRTNRYP